MIYEEFLSRQNFELAFYRIKHGTNSISQGADGILLESILEG